jgi:16S rRNA processing protein RimM
VVPLSEVRERFQPGSVLLANGSHDRPLTVAASRQHQRRLLVRFDEIADRGAAEALHGTYLFVPADAAPRLPDGTFWPHQLIGCRVVTDTGRPVGSIREVLRTPANDVWVVDGPSGEVLVPALVSVVSSVDLAARQVVVSEGAGFALPPGE